MADSLSLPLSALNDLRRWTAWQTELVPGRDKPTKVPYFGLGQQAQANNPYHYLTRREAEVLAASLPKPFGLGGVGLWLGDLGVTGYGKMPAELEALGLAGYGLGGIDYDSCIGPLGVSDWAALGIGIIDSYGEVSPSGEGAKQFWLYRMGDESEVKSALGIANTGRKWADGSVARGEHGAAIEPYIKTRFFAVTGDSAGFCGVLRVVEPKVLRLFAACAVPAEWGVSTAAVGGSVGSGEISELGESVRKQIEAAIRWLPQFARIWVDDRSDLSDKSRSGAAFRLASLLREIGLNESEARSAILANAQGAADWLIEKGDARGGYEWNRSWSGAASVIGVDRVSGAGSVVLETVEGLSSTDPGPAGGDNGGSAASVSGLPPLPPTMLVPGSGGILSRLPPGMGAAVGSGPPLILGDHPDGRVLIYYDEDRLPEILEIMEWALAVSDVAIYTRKPHLVAPVMCNVKNQNDEDVTIPGFERVMPALMRAMLSRCSVWRRLQGRKLVPCVVPDHVVMGMLSKDGKRLFPEVGGLTTVPGLWPDGSLHSEAGYDARLNVHRVSDDGLKLPADWESVVPVKVDAEAARDRLLGLLEGYAFAGESGTGNGIGNGMGNGVGRSVAMAMILTCVARASVPVAPVFAITGTGPGSGKSHLADLASVIATGRRAPVAAAGETDEETEKRLGGLIFEGAPILALDNVNRVLRSMTLTQVASQQRLKIRLLGSSATPEVEFRGTVIVNGNGLALSGDMVRRHLSMHLEPSVEMPENRLFSFDPVVLIEQGRGGWVADCLTILRAHILAGCPGATGMKPLGTYERWSRLIRGALIWLDFPDPIQSMDAARLEDPDLKSLRDFLNGWYGFFGDGPKTLAEAITLAQAGGATATSGLGAIEQINGEDKAKAREILLQAMQQLGGVRGVIDPLKLSRWLRSRTRTIVGGKRFIKAPGSLHGIIRWSVEKVNDHLKPVPSPQSGQ